ncbi:hypothetical protein K523DRAFT_351800 [Schizophyllum commune Tattone D]|nr:hypothetical protein K523DRAFT_351800 [Schizophyllum commune Tattone D]
MRQTPFKPPSFLPDDVQSAQDYIDRVKEYFPEELETYQEFKAILRATCDHKINLRQCVQQVLELFRGYPELIVGFNAFCPPGSILDPNTCAILRLGRSRQ